MSASLALQAAIDGVGVALALRPLVQGDIESGRLVMPFDIEADTNYAYYLAVPQAVAKRPEVESFRRWLLAQARAESIPAASRVAV